VQIRKAYILALALALALAAPSPAHADFPITALRARDCAFGLLDHCLVGSDARTDAPPTKFRIEILGAYKLANFTYGKEIRGCREAGCRLGFTGPAWAFDASYNLAGNPHGDDYYDLGLSVSYLPVVSAIRDNPRGFAAQFGEVLPGDGDLGYLSLRLSLRAPSFLHLFFSKYLISALGAGVSIPIARGAAGSSFTGADSPKFSLGGRLGVQVPITSTVQLGVSSLWNVIWYGREALHLIFASAYGVNLSFQL
jgi:hypothetical protein